MHAAGEGRVIAVRVTIPIACWRIGAAREYLETYELPPPATCYGALLSLVGEEERDKHRGCRVTAGILAPEPTTSVVVRTLWRVKDKHGPAGNKENARPDFQQLRVQSDLIVWVDSTDERLDPPLEARVRNALLDSTSIDRFGGLSLGESTHLVNDVWLLADGRPPEPCRTFVVDPEGTVTLPTWVDHVGSTGTRFVVGRFAVIVDAPPTSGLPIIG
jgi:CRISPR-associated protein Cas5t